MRVTFCLAPVKSGRVLQAVISIVRDGRMALGRYGGNCATVMRVRSGEGQQVGGRGERLVLRSCFRGVRASLVCLRREVRAGSFTTIVPNPMRGCDSRFSSPVFSWATAGVSFSSLREVVARRCEEAPLTAGAKLLETPTPGTDESAFPTKVFAVIRRAIWEKVGRSFGNSCLQTARVGSDGSL